MTACVCFEMLVGCAPFYNESIEETANKIENEDLKLPTFLSPEAADLLHRMLQKDKEKRMKSIRLALLSPWIVKYTPEEVNCRTREALVGVSRKR